VLILIAIVSQYLHEGVLVLALTIASIPYGAMLGIFLLGVLTKRANSRGTLVGAVLGLAALILVVIGNAFGTINIAWTWYVVIGTLVTFFGGWIISVITSRHSTTR
jgi:Na+/proline symporter